MSSPLLSLPEFCRVFCEYFEFDAESVGATTRLVDDLAFDSVMFLEVILMFEEVAVHSVPEDLADALITVADVHHYYMVYSGESAS
jgi:acyl carrier protein